MRLTRADEAACLVDARRFVLGERRALAMLTEDRSSVSAVHRAVAARLTGRASEVDEVVARCAAGAERAAAYLRDHAHPLDRKLRNVACAETSRAFNEAKRLLAERAPKGFELVWNATLDEQTCETCWERHGEVVDSKSPKPLAHPHCRCVLTLARKRKGRKPIRVESWDIDAWKYEMSDRCDHALLSGLSTSDVHQPGPMKRTKKTATGVYESVNATLQRMRGVTAAAPAAEGDKGDSANFALPRKRRFPIGTAKHASASAKRLEQDRKAGKLTAGEYATAKARIAKASKRFGLNRRSRMNFSYSHPTMGRVQFSHPMMRDGAPADAHCMRQAMPLLDAALADGPTWVNIAVSGRFEGHRSGPFELGPQVFAEIIRNYREVDRGEVAFDFEHASEMPASEGSVPSEGAPAQAWIKDLKVEGTRLYALVEWKEPARTYIREGKYKYVSPAIRFGARHPITGQNIGARLTSVALTNQPFLRGLEPLHARDTEEGRLMSDDDREVLLGAYAYSADEYMPAIRAALKLPELCTAYECANALERLAGHYAVGEGAPVHGVDVGGYISRLRDAMRVPMSATVPELLEAVAAMIEAVMQEHNETEHGGASMVDGHELLAEDDDPETEEDTNMSDKAIEKLTAEVTTLSADKTTLASNVASLTGEVTALKASEATLKDQAAELSLALKDEQAKVVTLSEQVATKDARIAELEKQVTEEADKRLSDRVEEAFETYKADRKLTDEDKESMLLFAKAKPEKFEARYPRLTAAKRHLMADITGNEAGARVLPLVREQGESKTVSLRDAAKKLAAEKHIPLDEAQRIVVREAGKKR